jgi:RNA polymerase sigma-70 factor (ECF subfamily)
MDAVATDVSTELERHDAHLVRHWPEAPAADELASLLGLAAGGCVVSFERLYGCTSHRLFAIILRINSDRAEAEELLQDTYIKVSHECRQFDASRGRVTHWMASVARNGAIDSMRRKQARPRRGGASIGEDDDPYDGFASPDRGPVERLASQQEALAVRFGLDALPTEHRQSLSLAFHAGLSYEEVALHLGRPVGTVKVWIRGALACLREQVHCAR